MKAATIGKCLRVHRRIMSCGDPRMLEIISKFDELYASRHVLAHLQGLELLTTKCHIANNPAVSSQLLLWCAEHIYLDVMSGQLSPDESKAGLQACINRALLKRRVCHYLIKKLTVPDEFGGHRAFADSFASMGKFKESGFDSMNSAAWLSDLPPFQVEAVAFMAKILRHSPALDEVWMALVGKDPTIQAEVALTSSEFKHAGFFDLEGVLAGKEEWLSQKRAQLHPSPAEPAPVAPPAAEETRDRESDKPLESEPAAETKAPMEDRALQSLVKFDRSKLES